MERVPIRNRRSAKKIKPRVFDALISGKEVLLEIKDSRKGNETIALDDALEQIEEAKAALGLNRIEATEP